MSPLLRIAAPVILILHGLIHLLGTAVYLKLAEVAEFPYKTTLLGGRWDLGPTGIQVFGVLWTVAAIGFLLSAAVVSLDGPNWRSLLAGVTLFSLVLTTLDWTVAYAGIVVNGAILAALLLLPRG